ncbi:MAG: hypothetical protein JXX28_08685 [Deltaproteobacteria bacterium]|nr:hypothetical protein [Deltaproteobacteria bacterium]
MILLLATLALAEPGESPVEDPIATTQPAPSGISHEELAALQQELRDQRAELDALRAVQAPTPSVDRVGFGQGSVVRADERVEEVTAFGGDVHVLGAVSGDATAFGGDVIVEPGGQVLGDAVSFGGKVRVLPGGDVRGDRVSFGRSPLTPVTASGWTAAVSERLMLLLSFLGTGVLTVGLMPLRVARIAKTVDSSPLLSLFVGVFAAGALLLASLLFGLTLIGLPVTLFLMGLLGLTSFLGAVGMAIALGDRVPALARAERRWMSFLLGGVLLGMVAYLPWVGPIALLTAGLLGLGAAMSSQLGGR